MSSSVRTFLTRLAGGLLPVLGLLCLLVSQVAAVDEVDVDSEDSIAYREGLLPGEFLLVRSGSASVVTVTFTLAGTAVIGTDYTLMINGVATAAASSYTATFAAGVLQIPVTITPLPTDIVEFPEGQTNVILALQPNAGTYSIGASSAASVIIADNSLVATITAPLPLATDDTAANGPTQDPQRNRRGIVEVQMLPLATLGLPEDPTLTAARTVEVSVGGTATLGTKYNLYWKVGGSTVGAGMGYQLTYFYPVGATTVGITLPSGVSYTGTGTAPLIILRPNGSGGFYTDSYTAVLQLASNNINLPPVTGPTALTDIIFQSTNDPTNTVTSGTPGLIANDLVGQTCTFAGIGDCLITQAGGFPIGANVVEVSGGIGGFLPGDLVSFTGTGGLYFLVGSAVDVQVDGTTVTTLTFTGGYADASAALPFGPNGGLPVQLALTTPVISEFPITSTVKDVVVPATSSQVEYSIEPTTGNPPSGAQTVTLTMSQSYDYDMSTPTVASVTIADATVQANVTLGTNASQPATAGSFLVTLNQAFPVAITVPYAVFQDSNPATPGNPPSVPGDYFQLPGSVTIPAGATSASIAVIPIATDATLPPGGKDVGVTLLGSLDYKLAGSGTTLTNPSATLNISPSLGEVAIVGSTQIAYMNPSVPGTTTFTININRPVSSTQAVVVNYTVGGSAVQGVDYQPLTTFTPSGYSTSGTVTIPANSSSATILITPVEDSSSSGILQVLLTLTAGQGYTIDPNATSAAVSIQSDTPQLLVTAVSNAMQPNTAGIFTVSYPGVPAGTALNRPVPISYTLTGSATIGTDYANPGTVTIPAGATSVNVLIAPTNNPLLADESVTFTLNPSASYSIVPNAGTATMSLVYVPQSVATTTGSGTAATTTGVSSGGGGTTSGQATYSASSGGCGLGGGMGLLVVLLALAYRRR